MNSDYHATAYPIDWVRNDQTENMFFAPDLITLV